MAILTDDMKRVVREQRLCFAATVSPDGTPNLSPKGTTAVWDDDHILFADIASPGTVENLRANPAIEINLVDQVTRKGYRFKGTAELVSDGPVVDAMMAVYGENDHVGHDLSERIRALVLVRVERALPLVSPAYLDGRSEAEISESWLRYWHELWAGRA
jgi:uncharacterized protein